MFDSNPNGITQAFKGVEWNVRLRWLGLRNAVLLRPHRSVCDKAQGSPHEKRAPEVAFNTLL